MDNAADGERLRQECERYGLPVGLAGLLRHIYGNRDLTISIWQMAAGDWKARALAAEGREEALRTAMADLADTAVVALVDGAQRPVVPADDVRALASGKPEGDNNPS